MNRIAYKKGFKYQTVEPYVTKIDIHPDADIETEYIILTSDGTLVINRGYAWDGPSGPTIDTATFMRGSLVHDALYQLFREGHLDREKYRQKADRILQECCIDDGMFQLRALWVYAGVVLGAESAADPRNKKPVLYAPMR